jgi:ribosomal protein S18 acetylase RimI-like enzyme
MTEPDGITFRRPVPEDHPRIWAVVDEWWGGRRMRSLLPRLWLEHFASTSWLAERTTDGRLAGFVIGFLSQDDPSTAYTHMIATDPNRRRDGLGRALYERFFEDARARGAVRVTAVTWPGNRISVAFHRAVGFVVDASEGTQPLYGTPAHPDHDGEGEDRVVFLRDL